ncbi:MAG: hypothetical protein IH931_02260 [candidate division Zixibacteria bacterium]|nr:hypothetical protein [candidate division Zixibacteria bacterium]
MISSIQRYRLFFGVVLVVMAMSLAPVFAADTIRLKKEVVPTFQAIDLKIDAREADYSGTVSIDLEVLNPTNEFIFHAEDIELNKVVLTGGEKELDYTLSTGEKGRVTLTTNDIMKKGSYKLEIDFTTSFNTQSVGLYKTEADGEAYLFTQFQESDARKAFPCFDEPAFKFPYQMTLRVPEEHIAIANTPVAKETSADGWKTYEFEKTKPLPSYLLAIAAGPLETRSVTVTGVPMDQMLIDGHIPLLYELNLADPITVFNDCLWIEIRATTGETSSSGRHWFWAWSSEQNDYSRANPFVAFGGGGYNSGFAFHYNADLALCLNIQYGPILEPFECGSE